MLERMSNMSYCVVAATVLCVSNDVVVTKYLANGGLVVGRRTCDLRVASSRPSRDAAVQKP